jgi:hypothetical protein
MIVFGIEKAEEFHVQIVVNLHEKRPLLNGLLSRLKLRMKRFLLLLLLLLLNG